MHEYMDMCKCSMLIPKIKPKILIHMHSTLSAALEVFCCTVAAFHPWNIRSEFESVLEGLYPGFMCGKGREPVNTYMANAEQTKGCSIYEYIHEKC